MKKLSMFSSNALICESFRTISITTKNSEAVIKLTGFKKRFRIFPKYIFESVLPKNIKMRDPLLNLIDFDCKT